MLKYFFGPKMPCIYGVYTEQSGCPCVYFIPQLFVLAYVLRSINVAVFFVGGIGANAFVFCLPSPIYITRFGPLWKTAGSHRATINWKQTTVQNHDLLGVAYSLRKKQKRIDRKKIYINKYLHRQIYFCIDINYIYSCWQTILFRNVDFKWRCCKCVPGICKQYICGDLNKRP